MHDSVVFADPEVGKFDRYQPYTLDFWIKLRPKTYEDVTLVQQGPGASILYTSGGVEVGRGYDVQLQRRPARIHDQPQRALRHDQGRGDGALPRNSWQHITITGDGNCQGRRGQALPERPGRPRPGDRGHG